MRYDGRFKGAGEGGVVLGILLYYGVSETFGRQVYDKVGRCLFRRETIESIYELYVVANNHQYVAVFRLYRILRHAVVRRVESGSVHSRKTSRLVAAERHGFGATVGHLSAGHYAYRVEHIVAVSGGHAYERHAGTASLRIGYIRQGRHATVGEVGMRYQIEKRRPREGQLAEKYEIGSLNGCGCKPVYDLVTIGGHIACGGVYLTNGNFHNARVLIYKYNSFIVTEQE